MKKQTGFTLVELIVAVTIMALLASVGVVSYGATALKSRDAKRLSDMEIIRSALEICRSQDGAYPMTITTRIVCPTTGALVPLKITPLDPKSADGYTYNYSRTATTYTLSTQLEDLNNCKGTLADGRCQYSEP